MFSTKDKECAISAVLFLLPSGLSVCSFSAFGVYHGKKGRNPNDNCVTLMKSFQETITDLSEKQDTQIVNGGKTHVNNGEKQEEYKVAPFLPW